MQSSLLNQLKLKVVSELFSTQQPTSKCKVHAINSIIYYRLVFEIYIARNTLLFYSINIVRILLVDALVSERCSHLLLTD